MFTGDISLQYKHFLRTKADYHLGQLSNVTVLGEFLLNDAYFVLAEGYIQNKLERCIIIENISNPIFSILRVQPSSDNYVTINKNDLHKIIPKNLYKCLAKQGLATTVEIGMKCNKRFSWHRLVCCGYYNCLGKEIHHIDKNPKNNSITNLVPVNKELHVKLDQDVKNGLNLALLLQDINLYKKPTKNTLAKNDDIILDVLKMKTNGVQTKDIIQKVKKKIKKSTVYKILRKYYYADEFLKWLEIQKKQCFTEIDGKSNKKWEEIFKIEGNHY